MNISPEAKSQEVDNLFKSIVFYGYEQNLKKSNSSMHVQKKIPFSEMDVSTVPQNIDVKYDHLLNLLKEQNMTPLSFDLAPPVLRNWPTTPRN